MVSIKHVMILSVFFALITTTTFALEDNWRHYNYGMQRLQEKKYKAAMNQFSYYIRNEKIHRHMFGVAYFGMGLTHGAKGEYNLAIMKFMQAIENDLHPTVKISEKAYMNIGANYIRLKDYQNAIKAYSEVVKMNPQNGLAHYYLGLAYFRDENYDKAKYEADEARKLGVSFTALTDNLAKVDKSPSRKEKKQDEK